MRDLIAVLLALPLLTLASYRVWRLIALDQITEPIRNLILWREGRAWAWINDMIGCTWCLGFWISGSASLAWILTFDLSLWWLVLLWPSVSSLVGMLSWFDPSER